MSNNLDENLKHLKSKKRSRGGAMRVVLLIIVIFGSIAGLIAGITYLFSIERSAPVPGDAANFDPIAAYDEVRAYAGENAQLLHFEARFVRRDGTLDLTADYAPDVTYTFFRATSAEANSAPLGVPGSSAARADEQFYEQIDVKVWRPMQPRTETTNNSETSYIHLGMERDVRSPRAGLPGESLSAPVCDFEQLWTLALEAGAPPDAVAIIEYDVNGYHFEIRDTDIELDFDLDCTRR